MNRLWLAFLQLIKILGLIATIALATLYMLAAFLSIMIGGHRSVPKAACTSNLHAISVALKLYRDDYDAFPEALYGFVDAATSREITYLYPQYIKEKVVFRCP